jgi:nicotinate-nucleotide adenylyltransferase
MKNLNQPIGIFGGTFDPIHLGHLRLADEVYNQLGLKEIRFIPCNQSALKKQQPIASAADRLAMIKLAINPYSYFYADDQEIKQTGISYTVETLRSIRQENPNMPLCFIMAMDAFAEFNLWHKYQEITQLAYLIIANRTDISATAIRALIKQGKDASYMLPQIVWDYIQKHKLYI